MRQQKSEIKKIIDLVFVLTLREIKNRYKGSLLGPLWVILYPLLLTGVTTVVFSLFIKIDTGGLPYPVFVLSGIILWNFFSKSVNIATHSFEANRELIVETSAPAQAIPVAYILGQSTDLIINTLLLVATLFFMGYPLHPTLLLIPVYFLLIFVFILGFSLFSSTLNTLFRDAQNLIDPLLLIWLYLTPVFYPLEVVPERLRWLIFLNPMANFILFFRESIFNGLVPSYSQWLVMLVGAFASLLFGYWVFKKNRPIFADII